ncbi:MAG: CocE/NonD family hydrolase, partial [Planctomycetaceae bacterium]|nr:CocE/NonD family hydrolase [Planctomycetaceae bacterium]
QWYRDDGLRLGDVTFNSKTGEFYREKIEFPFFEYHLKGKGKIEHPEAWVFETGTNLWRKFETWPPEQMKQRMLYFHEDGELHGDLPKPAAGDEGFDEYVSDPKKPVPYLEKITPRMEKVYMTADQRFASRRPDVLVYSTGVLQDDLTIAGPIEVDLFVSTTGTDADWIVKVIDVYPDDYPDEVPPTAPPGRTPSTVSAIGLFAPTRMGGYQQLVRGDVMRGKFRTSFENPEPFVPGEPTRVRFTLHDTSHTFRTGHRLMIQVQSSWFPLVDRNPQVFTDIYSAQANDFKKATQRVYRTKEMPSGVGLPVLR